MGSFRSYLGRRLVEIVLIILGIAAVNFLLVHLAPGSPVQALGGDVPLTKEVVAEIERKWGLDAPLYQQLLLFYANLARGDLGYSFIMGRPVLTIILDRGVLTLFLTGTSTLLAILLGMFLGTYAAKSIGSKRDVSLSVTSLVFLSTPTFFLSLIFVYLLTYIFPIFPRSGLVSPGANPGIETILDAAYHTVLPVLALTLTNYPMFYQVTRASVVEVMNEDFVTTAKAKGLTERTVFYKHVLRNALIPVVTQSAIWLGFVLAGSILVETVFVWPGMGRLLYDSILKRDYPVLMGIFLVSSVFIALANLVADILYGILDPRVVYR